MFFNDRQRGAAHLGLPRSAIRECSSLCQCLSRGRDEYPAAALPCSLASLMRAVRSICSAVVQHHFLRMGNQRGKNAENRPAGCSLPAHAGALHGGCRGLSLGTTTAEYIPPCVSSPRPQLILRIMRILIQMTFSCFWRLHGTSAGDVSSPTFWLPILPPHRGNGAFHPEGGVNMHHDKLQLTPLRQMNASARIGSPDCQKSVRMDARDHAAHQVNRTEDNRRLQNALLAEENARCHPLSLTTIHYSSPKDIIPID